MTPIVGRLVARLVLLKAHCRTRMYLVLQWTQNGFSSPTKRRGRARRRGWSAALAADVAVTPPSDNSNIKSSMTALTQKFMQRTALLQSIQKCTTVLQNPWAERFTKIIVFVHRFCILGFAVKSMPWRRLGSRYHGCSPIPLSASWGEQHPRRLMVCA